MEADYLSLVDETKSDSFIEKRLKRRVAHRRILEEPPRNEEPPDECLRETPFGSDRSRMKHHAVVSNGNYEMVTPSYEEMKNLKSEGNHLKGEGNKLKDEGNKLKSNLSHENCETQIVGKLKKSDRLVPLKVNFSNCDDLIDFSSHPPGKMKRKAGYHSVPVQESLKIQPNQTVSKGSSRMNFSKRMKTIGWNIKENHLYPCMSTSYHDDIVHV